MFVCFEKEAAFIGGNLEEKNAHPLVAFQWQNYCYCLVHKERKTLRYYNTLMQRLLQDPLPIKERITLLEDALLNPEDNSLVLFLSDGYTGMHFGRGISPPPESNVEECFEGAWRVSKPPFAWIHSGNVAQAELDSLLWRVLPFLKQMYGENFLRGYGDIGQTYTPIPYLSPE